MSTSILQGIQARSVPPSAFYEALGFSIAYGGETGAFTSFRAGKGSLNLAKTDDQPPSTGRVRVIFSVDDVDAMYAHVLARGFTPETPLGTRSGASATFT